MSRDQSCLAMPSAADIQRKLIVTEEVDRQLTPSREERLSLLKLSRGAKEEGEASRRRQKPALSFVTRQVSGIKPSLDNPWAVNVSLYTHLFKTGSQESPMPNFLNILRSTSLSITVVCTWHPLNDGNCCKALAHLLSVSLNTDRATRTSSV